MENNDLNTNPNNLELLGVRTQSFIADAGSIPTWRVREKSSGAELTINVSDFDENLYTRIFKAREIPPEAPAGQAAAVGEEILVTEADFDSARHVRVEL